SFLIGFKLRLLSCLLQVVWRRSSVSWGGRFATKRRQLWRDCYAPTSCHPSGFPTKGHEAMRGLVRVRHAARRGSAQGQAVDSGVVLRHERRYGGSALEEDRPVV